MLSSVAGERARKDNFVYGSSKAGLDAFAQGLGDSLAGSGARVMVVRPGFVHTRMTEGMDDGPFSTTPEVVADAIIDGLRKGRHTVWAPALLRYVFGGLRHLPRPVWRKVSMTARIDSTTRGSRWRRSSSSGRATWACPSPCGPARSGTTSSGSTSMPTAVKRLAHGESFVEDVDGGAARPALASGRYTADDRPSRRPPASTSR